MILRHLLVLAAFGVSCASAQTTIEHSSLAYFVPGKRITVDAQVTDPKGVKVARTYFRAGAQADYTYVPMQYTAGSRYSATLPAPAAGTPSIEYLVLAQSNDGTVSRTQAYTMPARSSADAPSWQSTASRGDLKVYTELTNAPKTVAGFSDSITLDVAESSARLGAVAGLYGGASGGGAAGATASSTSSGAGGATATTATTTTTTAAATTATTAGTAAGAGAAAATAGGISTAAIIGGVAVAGVAAAAAGSGGGGGSTSTPPPPATQSSPFAGTWSGTASSPDSVTCTGGGITSTTTCTLNQTWTAVVDAQGNFSLTLSGGLDVCTGSTKQEPPFTISGLSIPSSGVVRFPVPTGQQGLTPETCTDMVMTFTLSPRQMTGSSTCTVVGSPPGQTCTGGGTTTLTGTGSP